jgi:hypothetical protein
VIETSTPTSSVAPASAPVQLPSVSAPELAALVQRMIGGEPEAAERIKRGVAVLLSGALAETAELGVYRVTGCEGREYTTTSGSCDCPDATRRAVTCKHQWSARLLSAMSAAVHFERCQACYLLTVRGLAATVAPGA